MCIKIGVLSAMKEMRTVDAIGQVLCQDITQIVRGVTKNARFRKGHVIQEEDIPVLLSLGKDHIYIWEENAQEMHENEAADVLRELCQNDHMTGAAIPKGCDCVVRQEDVTVQDECILVPYELHHHENYCFAGEDVRKGTLAVKRGTELTAAHLGVLASLGLGTVKVRRRPRIALASTGDELVLPGEPLRPGKIYNSNLYVLAGRLQELGFEPEVLGILPDDAEQAAAFIAGWREKVDLFLTTGGVSVGKKDIMHEVVRRIGTRLFWRVCIKPGAPVIAYTAGDMLGIALSGNPFASYATFELLTRPVLAALAGRGWYLFDSCAARLGFAVFRSWLQCPDRHTGRHGAACGRHARQGRPSVR